MVVYIFRVLGAKPYKIDELALVQEGFLDTSFQGDPEDALSYL